MVTYCSSQKLIFCYFFFHYRKKFYIQKIYIHKFELKKRLFSFLYESSLCWEQKCDLILRIQLKLVSFLSENWYQWVLVQLIVHIFEHVNLVAYRKNPNKFYFLTKLKSYLSKLLCSSRHHSVHTKSDNHIYIYQLIFIKVPLVVFGSHNFFPWGRVWVSDGGFSS